MRRKERQVTNPAEIRAVIDRCKVLRLGLNAAGAPYIVPMNFGWEMTDGLPVFYLHCANEGRKIDLLRADPRVGFEMDGAHGLREGQTPCAYSYFYESVVGSGEIRFSKTPRKGARPRAHSAASGGTENIRKPGAGGGCNRLAPQAGRAFVQAQSLRCSRRGTSGESCA